MRRLLILGLLCLVLAGGAAVTWQAMGQAKLVFGTQPPSGLALWAALFAGIAVLVASVGITTRRRRQP